MATGALHALQNNSQRRARIRIGWIGLEKAEEKPLNQPIEYGTEDFAKLLT